MLVGLSSKNAILIVEFAEQLRGRGIPLVESAVQAATIRLRPILMTSLAFILGVVPLVFATRSRRKRTSLRGHNRVRGHDHVDGAESFLHPRAVFDYRRLAGAWESCGRP